MSGSLEADSQPKERTRLTRSLWLALGGIGSVTAALNVAVRTVFAWRATHVYTWSLSTFLLTTSVMAAVFTLFFAFAVRRLVSDGPGVYVLIGALAGLTTSELAGGPASAAKALTIGLVNGVAMYLVWRSAAAARPPRSETRS